MRCYQISTSISLDDLRIVELPGPVSGQYDVVPFIFT
jgi:hypothetical protein